MSGIEKIRQKIVDTVVVRLVDTVPVVSITFVGSFLHSTSISVVSDIDIVVIVDKLTESIFQAIGQAAAKISGEDCGLPDYNTKLNMSFGPLKFNTAKTIIFHLMVYDIAGHRNHVKASPFVCYDWEQNRAVYGKNLTSLYSAAPLQLGDLIGTRRGLHSYLDDLERGVISFRYYEFHEGIVSEKRDTYSMDDRHKKEYGFHVMKYLMLNLLKILRQQNISVNDTELAAEFRRIDDIFSKHASFFLELSAWKHAGGAEPINIRSRLERFIDNMAEWLEEIQKSLPRIFFIRHAATMLNDGTFLGVRRNPGIITKHCEQLQTEKFDSVYTGTLKRTVETGELLAGIRHKQDELLNEIDYGLAEGLNRRQLAEKYPEIINAWENGDDPKFPEGECQSDVEKRLLAFIEKELLPVKTGTVAVITHNVVIRTLLRNYFKAELRDIYKMIPGHLEFIPGRLFNSTLIPELTAEQKIRFRDQLLAGVQS